MEKKVEMLVCEIQSFLCVEMDSDRWWMMFVLPILIVMVLFGSLYHGDTVELTRLRRSLDDEEFDYNSVTEIDQNPDIAFMDYPIAGPSKKHEEGQFKLKKIQKDLDESFLHQKRDGFKIEYGAAKRKDPSILFSGVVEETPAGKFALKETRKKDNPFWASSSIAFDGIDLTNGGKEVTVAYVPTRYNGNMVRSECEISKLLCGSGVTVCPRFCSNTNRDGEALFVVEKLGRGLYIDRLRKMGQRYSLIDTMYVGKRMLENLRTLFDEFGYIHSWPDLSNWYYANPQASYNPRTDDIVLVQFEGKAVYYSEIVGTNHQKRTPKYQILRIIDNMATLASGSTTAMKPVGQFDFISGALDMGRKQPFNPLSRLTLTDEEYRKVRDNLGAISREYEAMTHDERPPFERLVDLIQDNIQVLENCEERESKNPAGF
jgi:hypothetical protein